MVMPMEMKFAFKNSLLYQKLDIKREKNYDDCIENVFNFLVLQTFPVVEKFKKIPIVFVHNYVHL